MLDDLFVTDSTNPTSVGDIELSQDKDSWSQEIQMHIIESIPVLEQIQGNLSLDMFDEDKGYIKGSYVVPLPSESGDVITIPTLVKGGRLYPPDVYVYKGEFRPVDNDEIAALLTNPSIGEEAMDPDDIPELGSDGFGPQVYPPGTYGNGYVTTLKSGSVNKEILEKLTKDKALLFKIGSKRNFKEILGNLLDKDEVVLKKAAVIPISHKDEIIVHLGKGRYSVKRAALIDNEVHEFDNETDFQGLVKWTKGAKLDTARILDEIKDRGYATTWNEKKTASLAGHRDVKSLGEYTAYCNGKPQALTVVGKIAKTAGKEPWYLGITPDKKFVLQPSIFGAKSNRATKVAKLNEKPKAGDVFTFKAQPGYYAEPIKIASITAFNNVEAGVGFTINGKTVSDNSPISCVFLKRAGLSHPIKVRNVPKGIFARSVESWMLPANTEVIKLSNQIKVASNADELMDDLAMNKQNVMAKLSMLNIRDGKCTVRVNDGPAKTISQIAGYSLMKQAGINNVTAAGLALSNKKKEIVGDTFYKEASRALNPISIDDAIVRNYTTKKAADYSKVKLNKIDPMILVKVASEIDNDEAIADVLSIAYADPTNLSVYKEHLLSLKETEEILSRLLITTRLGQQSLDEKDVRSALFQLHDIIKALETEI